MSYMERQLGKVLFVRSAKPQLNLGHAYKIWKKIAHLCLKWMTNNYLPYTTVEYSTLFDIRIYWRHLCQWGLYVLTITTLSSPEALNIIKLTTFIVPSDDKVAILMTFPVSVKVPIYNIVQTVVRLGTIPKGINTLIDASWASLYWRLAPSLTHCVNKEVRCE